MINLIPNEEKKKIKRDFVLRFASALFLLSGFSFVLMTVLLFPSYFLLTIKENIVKEQIEKERGDVSKEIDSNVLDKFGDLDKQLVLVEGVLGKKYVVSRNIINEIVLQKSRDIKINQIYYESDAKTGKKITIRGTAPSRERLLIFRQALENNVAFKKVDLPISNFVKGSNIQFSLVLIPS